MILVHHYLILGAILFAIGTIGFLTRRNVIVALPLKPDDESPDGGRVTLLNRELTIRWAGKVDRADLDDRAIAHALRKHFGIAALHGRDVDDGLELRALA